MRSLEILGHPQDKQIGNWSRKVFLDIINTLVLYCALCTTERALIVSTYKKKEIGMLSDFVIIV